MVKIVFDFLDLLTPSSKEAYKQCIISRFDSLAKSTRSISLESELEKFASSTTDMNRDGYYTDRFDLIREYAISGSLKSHENPFPLGPKLVREHLYNLDDAIQDVLALELTSDAAIVRCLLGLHELPDCTLWLLAKETTAFCSTIIRTLPVSPFFESITRIWRILDIFDSESNGTVLASFDTLATKMGALGHEALVRVSESRLDVEDAVKNSWVGIHLVSSHLNREASVEQFSPNVANSSFFIKNPSALKVHQQQQQSLKSQASSSFEDANDMKNNDDDGCCEKCGGLTSPSPSPVRATAASASTTTTASSNRGFAVAKGISSLGHVILVNVPELADNVKANLDVMTPLLFTQQSQPIRKNFCFCKCFWTGVGTGVIGAVGAVTTFAVIGLVVITTIRSFSIAIKNSKK